MRGLTNISKGLRLSGGFLLLFSLLMFTVYGLYGCNDNGGGGGKNCCQFLETCQGKIGQNNCTDQGGQFFQNAQCSADTGLCTPLASPTPTPTATPTPAPTPTPTPTPTATPSPTPTATPTPGPTPTPSPGATLSLSLDDSLTHEGDTKATSFTKADLLDTGGMVVATGTISMDGTTAVFDLSGVTMGDYFIEVNDLDQDLVPTRIDDPTVNVTQFVGEALRQTVIGSLGDPTYRILTFSEGQGEHPVVKYSDGMDVSPEEFAYALITLKTNPQSLEINVLGTADPVSSYENGAHPTSGLPDLSTWILGPDNHGEAKDDNPAQCTGCHGDLNSYQADYGNIIVNNGWCYKCHNGPDGDEEGFVDPTQ